MKTVAETKGRDIESKRYRSVIRSYRQHAGKAELAGSDKRLSDASPYTTHESITRVRRCDSVFAHGRVEETPAIRAKRLLGHFETAFQQKKPFGERSKVLEHLAAISTEVQDELWKILEGGSRPHLRWLAMEILAPYQWSRVMPVLLHGLRDWDLKTERAAWLGAAVTVRNHPVPEEFRSFVADALRARLEYSAANALAGHDLAQTEVVCEAIDTFRSFAAPADLPKLRRLWQADCTFTVQLRAFDAASMVARRYPDDVQTDSFFAQEREFLAERFSDLARERMIAIENGALLWRVAGLLLARLGDEALEIVTIAEKHRSLIGKFRRLVREAEQHLVRNGCETWLVQRRPCLVSLQERLAHAERQ